MRMPSALESAAELGGYVLAHAVWRLAEDGALAPTVGAEAHGGERRLLRFGDKRLEDALNQARDFMDANPERVLRAAFVYDGYIALGGRRRDALVLSAVEYGHTRRSLEVVLPYRVANAAGPLHIQPPHLLGLTGALSAHSRELAQALERGVAQHPQAAAAWAAALAPGEP